MIQILQREAVYLWYYFDLQLRQIFGYWVLGMVLGSVISVFVKERIHGLFRSLGGKRLGVLGIFAASALGIASPLCMYGTIPLAASFSESGMEDDWLAALRLLEKTHRGRIDLIYIDIIAEFDTKPRNN